MMCDSRAKGIEQNTEPECPSQGRSGTAGGYVSSGKNSRGRI